MGDSQTDELADEDDRFHALENLIFGGPTGDLFDETHLRPRASSAIDINGSCPLRLAPNAFVDYVASINTIKSSHGNATFERLPKNSGNSRADPTRFVFMCNIGQCTYSNAVYSKITRHRGTCKGLAPKAFVHACDVCKETFRSKVTIRHHKRDSHTDQVRKCVYCGEQFSTIKERPRHYLAQHDSIEDGPIPCPCADARNPVCTSPNHTWGKWGSLRAHLRKCHHLQKPQMVELLGPRIIGQHFTRAPGNWQCPAKNCVQGCASRVAFRAHLRDIHHMSSDEIASVLRVTDPVQTEVVEDETQSIEDHDEVSVMDDDSVTSSSESVRTEVAEVESRSIRDDDEMSVIDDDSIMSASELTRTEVVRGISPPFTVVIVQTAPRSSVIEDRREASVDDDFGSEVDFGELVNLFNDNGDDSDDNEFGYAGELDQFAVV